MKYSLQSAVHFVSNTNVILESWTLSLSSLREWGRLENEKKQNTLSKLLAHVYVSCIRINVVFIWDIETIDKMQLLFVNICMCSPVSR